MNTEKSKKLKAQVFLSNLLIKNSKPINVAIQGIKGSFHHLAAKEFLGNNIKLTECSSFSEMPELLKNESVDVAIMAIESADSGAILSNYGLIDKHNLNIQGEVYLPMVHNLMALKDQTIEDITEVWSHPIAIKNCERFFKQYPHIKIIEEKDTAFVAKQIKLKKLKGVAAIASKNAASIYGLNIIKEAIQTDTYNMARFLILNKRQDFNIDVNLHSKVSLKLITNHELGNLAEILSICANHNLNLSKIQSMPIENDPFNYAFFIDLSFNDYLEYCNALLILEKKVSSLRILGEYSVGKQNLEQMSA